MATNADGIETVRVLLSVLVDVSVYSDNRPARFADWRYAIANARFTDGTPVPDEVLRLIDDAAVFDQAQAAWRAKP